MHPTILELYASGALEQQIEQELREGLPHLQPEEAAVLAILQ